MQVLNLSTSMYDDLLTWEQLPRDQLLQDIDSWH